MADDLLLRRLEATVGHLDARTTIPPDMERWDVAHRRTTMERGAIMVSPIVRDLAEQSDGILAASLRCRNLLDGAMDAVLPFDRADARDRSARIHLAIVGLAERFHELAAVTATLRPLADRLSHAAGVLDRSTTVATMWAPDTARVPAAGPGVAAIASHPVRAGTTPPS